MYHAKVVLTRKLRKNDLPVKSGDTVGIIRTTSCPKGKWLARDRNNKCEFSPLPLFPLTFAVCSSVSLYHAFSFSWVHLVPRYS